MENILDHLYTSTPYDSQTSVEFTYKMSGKETEDLVKLRVSNQHLFSGKRNAAKYAWRSILKHMGLQRTVTHCQASKKWDNLKKKYKELKHPLEGVKVSPDQWPFFSLMSEALGGRLSGSAPLLLPQTSANTEDDFLPSRKRKRTPLPRSTLRQGPTEVEVLLSEEEGSSREMELDMEEEVEKERATLERGRATLEGDRALLEREMQALQREKAGMEREMAALERERAVMERERAVMERERAVMEGERRMMEKDRAVLIRDKRVLDRDRKAVERLGSVRDGEMRAEEGEEQERDSALQERRERFLNLFEKLIEAL
ncbi:uncharacterized protein si:dkeyp-38g8.5 isoform X1 [Hypomesus transpacificus]|uniref:uncharacterized protein si:dkeyp-38g8.5 isoform X1 n=2 Tax=Hypomesus transpacificus TaxID=137520 RepID=UPI001F076E1E|nr:uncharacterized protein si:dkeyp-38g8.5 isoform X1 [Hypomesus transpacificus]